MENTVFGLTEQQITEFGLTWGIGGFILLMLFIIYSVARESRAGRFGTFVLFFVLVFGLALCILFLFLSLSSSL